MGKVEQGNLKGFEKNVGRKNSMGGLLEDRKVWGRQNWEIATRSSIGTFNNQKSKN